MKNELYFHLWKEREVLGSGGTLRLTEYEDVDAILELIATVPKSWGHAGWIDGELTAPARMLTEEMAVQGLWLDLGDFNGAWPFTVSQSDRARDITPDIAALLVGKKNPHVVRFDKAGYRWRNKMLTFEQARTIAAYYVLRGYRGPLHFASEAVRGDFSKSPLSLDLQLTTFPDHYPEVDPKINQGVQRPRVRLQWQESLGGKRDGLQALESACRRHKLREFELIGADHYYRHFQVQRDFFELLEFGEPLAKPLQKAVEYQEPLLVAAE